MYKIYNNMDWNYNMISHKFNFFSVLYKDIENKIHEILCS